MTGSFLFQRAAPILQNVRDNDWGEAFCDFHLHRNEGAEMHFAVSGGSFQLQCVFENNELFQTVTLHVAEQARGAFSGHAFGVFNSEERVWSLRGCQKDSSVAILLAEDDHGEPGSVSLLLVGVMGKSSMQGKLVVEDHIQDHPLKTGKFWCVQTTWVEPK